jgi:hypothetical protein
MIKRHMTWESRHSTIIKDFFGRMEWILEKKRHITNSGVKLKKEINK